LALLALVPLGYAVGAVPGAVLAVLASQFAGWPVALAFKWRLGLMSWRSEAVWPLALLLGGSVGWLVDWVLGALLR
jgi:hypothetical protein